MNNQKLVKSTSGIRGIVGPDGLEPVLAASYGAAFGTFLKSGKVVVGRDSRPSGAIIMPAVIAGLAATGLDIVDIGIVPTPTVEIAVKQLGAAGGICVTASHNPSQWNALKFFNERGEFITPAQYHRLDKIFNSGKFAYQPHSHLGTVEKQHHWIDEHVKKTLAVKAVKRNAVQKRKFKVVIDAINGAGSTALPLILKELGCKVIELNCAGNGKFVHEPEPVAKNLGQLMRAVRRHKADLGMACDPDADRLALVDNRGQAIGEELTLTIAVAAVLSGTRGATVINLSTSRVTDDIARRYGSRVLYSKVGESNVVQMMREKRGVIGGEGNGGVIYPAFHAGRDALIAVALVLTYLATENKSLAEVVETFPRYYNIKAKGHLKPNFAAKLKQLEKEVPKLLGKTKTDRRDGLRFDFEQGWLQIRSSNTEPIFRVIVETDDQKLTDSLSKRVLKIFR